MNYPQPGYQPAQQYAQGGYVQTPQPVQQQPQYPGYPQAPAGYPPQQQFQPPQAPAVPLAQGTIDDFYNQPSAGGGPSISWKDKPIPTTYVGIVARDVTQADIQQQTDPQTKQPKFFKDGRPQFVMKVPLLVQRSPEFPEGEATLFVRGQMKDELARAMAEAGVDGAPRKGAGIAVTLAGKRPTGAIPANQFAIQYQPASGAGAASPAPAPQAPVQQPEPVQQYAQQPVAQPPVEQPQYQQAPQQYAQAPAQPQFQPPVQQAPQQFAQQAPAQPAAPQAPADFNAEQADLLAKLTNRQAG